ncbi:MAG: CoA-binding protein, partial [Thermodesulfobacteriota bacterium]|nr:CoA-binding protein [Thermodesulfobacteriota bacterium]
TTRKESTMTEMGCQLPDYNPPSAEIKDILASSRKIAVVGLSPKGERDSNRVARYLMENGYEIIPVNPGQKEILGKRCYRTLNEIPFEVDVVDLFLNQARVPPVVDQAIEIGAKVIWMQLGVIHNEAAEKARKAGIQVIMNLCIKQEHEKTISHEK